MPGAWPSLALRLLAADDGRGSALVENQAQAGNVDGKQAPLLVAAGMGKLQPPVQEVDDRRLVDRWVEDMAAAAGLALGKG